MASPKLPWKKLWKRVWKMIPDPLTDGKSITVLDDCINPKIGKKIFACHNFFDHAANANQSKYPWAQNFVAVGLLKVIKGRWASLPLAFRFNRLKKDLNNKSLMGKQKIEFQTKFEQAAEMIIEISDNFENADILTIEAGFKELKRDIGSVESQTRKPFAVTNHLQFCMMATSLTWIYADQLKKVPHRRHAIKGRKHFAFSDIRRRIAEDALDDNFDRLFPVPHKSILKSIANTLLRIAA